MEPGSLHFQSADSKALLLQKPLCRTPDYYLGEGAGGHGPQEAELTHLYPCFCPLAPLQSFLYPAARRKQAHIPPMTPILLRVELSSSAWLIGPCAIWPLPSPSSLHVTLPTYFQSP